MLPVLSAEEAIAVRSAVVESVTAEELVTAIVF
jgi:hypothetical protein